MFSGLIASVLVGLLLSLVPAIALTRGNLSLGVQREARSSTATSAEQRTLSVLVSVQVALAVMLLVGATLLGRSFLALVQVDPGFGTQDLLTAVIVLVPPTYPDLTARNRLLTDAIRSFEGLPGVERVGVTNFLPYSGMNTVDRLGIVGHQSEQPLLRIY